jgi:hypothetical protein
VGGTGCGVTLMRMRHADESRTCTVRGFRRGERCGQEDVFACTGDTRHVAAVSGAGVLVGMT